ncbi:TylF/MycF/NovP-related O-methyltransferase [Mesorhizobium sp. VK4C]|uniref:TylF/MycF/NovP-related O-methyltransferase n=1 Tax=Mesorhizobium captivum TaxID=3072319 RepID=UPI002A248068|nr:TylF/MycF/NovP-related O-methyltransferase [Mesorhizobium sp. VK4C]MDX8501906.1 TylF/MycF/NovP-related O-methyltransferase [Mesorhizobium sp. VK4C]
MSPEDLSKLKLKLREAVAERQPGSRVAIAGWSPAAFEIALDPVFTSGAAELIGIFAGKGGGSVMPLEALPSHLPGIVVIAEDAGKEPILEAIALTLPAKTKIVIGGFSHFEFSDPVFESVRRDLFIPSFANGYRHCLVHIYQCLQNAHRLGLKGCVAEFGMFKGGTTMLISLFIEALGANWKVYGFDTFDGFPDKRSPLDMYSHPDCVFLDVEMVKAVFADRNVEVVKGDVVETVAHLAAEELVLSFVDTDNFTSAEAIIRVIAERTQIGGAIVFDHWTGHDRHIDTIGERIAAKKLAADKRYFNLHGTGVFLRQL